MVSIDEFYGGLLASFAFNRDLAATVLILAAVLAIASLFIFKFYRSVSKRNLISLNLNQYNTSDHPLMSKLLAMLLYLLEYIIIMPLLIMLWFAGLAIVLLVIAQERLVGEILWISASIIGSIRILSYIRGEIARDLAKLFPFITLSVFILSWDKVDFSTIVDKFSQVPLLLSHILSFVLVVFVIEIIMRILFTIYDFWRSEGGTEEAMQEVLQATKQK